MFSFSFFLPVDAFFSSPDKTPGPDPRIRIVIHPPDHVIVPYNSSVFLNCVANYTAYQYVDDDYMEDSYAPYMEDNVDTFNEPQAEALHKTNDDDDDDRNECQSDVLYQWYRNDQPIKRNDTNFQTFCNGTIKIVHSSWTTAIYRCMANTRETEIGAVLSKSSDVQAAGLYFYFFFI